MSKNDLRDLLKTGVFGVMGNGKKFVVVDNRIIYQEGGFDYVGQVDGDLELPFYTIDKLVNACSFDNLITSIKANRSIIYDRKDYEPIEMTIAEIEEKLGIKNLKIKKEGI